MYSERKRRSAAGPSVKTDGMIRLNKFIASSGLYSRREADRLMEAGDVTVDDEIAQPGRMITGKEKIKEKAKESIYSKLARAKISADADNQARWEQQKHQTNRKKDMEL